MTLLEQALALFKAPLTIEAIRELDQLCDRARGEEAEQLGDLWSAAMFDASEDVYKQAEEEGLF